MRARVNPCVSLLEVRKQHSAAGRSRQPLRRSQWSPPKAALSRLESRSLATRPPVRMQCAVVVATKRPRAASIPSRHRWTSGRSTRTPNNTRSARPRTLTERLVPAALSISTTDKKARKIMRGALVYTPFVAGLAASLSLTLCLAPSGAGTDIFIFKDAGCNLALGQGFNTFAIPGSPGLTPHLFSSYAPGFPFVFGLFSIIFGCTAESNTLFKYVVGAVASGLFWGIAHTTMHSRLHKVTAGFLVGLFGPFALVSHDGDRPETLAFCFFVATCLATWRCKRGGTYISALLAGITALIHPFAGLLAFVVVWASAQARASESNASLDRLFSKRSLKISLQVALLALIPLLITSLSLCRSRLDRI